MYLTGQETSVLSFISHLNLLPGALSFFTLFSFYFSQAEADRQTKICTKCVDEDCATNIIDSQDTVAKVAVEAHKDGLDDRHDEELQKIHLPDDDSEADENGCRDDPRLDDVNEADPDDELILHLDQPEDQDGELSRDAGDDEGEAQGGHAVPLEEGHEEAEASQEHHHDVNPERVGRVKVRPAMAAVRTSLGEVRLGRTVVADQEPVERHQEELQHSGAPEELGLAGVLHLHSLLSAD